MENFNRPIVFLYERCRYNLKEYRACISIENCRSKHALILFIIELMDGNNFGSFLFFGFALFCLTYLWIIYWELFISFSSIILSSNEYIMYDIKVRFSISTNLCSSSLNRFYFNREMNWSYLILFFFPWRIKYYCQFCFHTN